MSADVVAYSSICDSDTSVYLAYLTIKLLNGFAEQSVSERGSRGVKANCGGRIDPGVSFSSAYRVITGAVASGALELARAATRRGFDGPVNRGAGSNWRGVVPTVSGVPSVSDGGGERRVVGDGGDDGSGSTEAGLSAGQVVGVRGPNFLRNKRNRDKLKRREQCALVSPTTPKPFFSELSDERRRELVESRAAAHIAENKRKEAVANQKVEELSKSVVGSTASGVGLGISVVGSKSTVSSVGSVTPSESASAMSSNARRKFVGGMRGLDARVGKGLESVHFVEESDVMRLEKKEWLKLFNTLPYAARQYAKTFNW